MPKADTQHTPVSLLATLVREAREAAADPQTFVSPDHELLLLCDDMARLHRDVVSLEREIEVQRTVHFGALKAARNSHRAAVEARDALARAAAIDAEEKSRAALTLFTEESWKAEKAANRKLSQPGRRLAKLKAKTPAGIFAKAIAVRHSGNTAVLLAKSLAEDILACAELRAVIWPVESARGVKLEDAA